MLNRQFLIASLLGTVAVAGIGVYMVSGHGANEDTSTPVAMSPADQHTSRAKPAPHSPIALNLKLSPMYSLDKKSEVAKSKHSAKKTARRSPANTRQIDSDAAARFAHVPPITEPLDLTLPPVDAPIVAGVPDDADAIARKEANAKPRNRPTTQKLNLNAGLSPSTADTDPSDNLFNRDNGLRGFMKQSWVSQNIGLQGGLAIKQERLREENSDLQDNMAVGMGVLLAF